MLSRLQVYPTNKPVNIIPEKLKRYDDFCKVFAETSKVMDISGHEWLVCESEGCMTHYFKNINMDERRDCLKKADVILYNQMAQDAKPIEETADQIMADLKKVNANDFKLVVMSKFVDKSSAKDGRYIFKLQETPYWDNAKWQESLKKEVPDEEMNYVKGWYVSKPDIQMLELVLDAVRV